MKKILAGFIVLCFFGLIPTGASSQWKHITMPAVDGQYSVTALASSGAYIYAGGVFNSYPRLFRSSDNGANWTRISDSLLFTQIYALASAGNSVYVGFQGQVLSSSDLGSDWNNITPPGEIVNAGDISVNAIALSGSIVFLGSVGEIVELECMSRRIRVMYW